MASVYDIISIVTFSLAGVCLFLAIFLWIKFDIWDIIGDLTGRSAKKSIEQMRTENEKSGKKSYRLLHIGVGHGNSVELITPRIVVAGSEPDDNETEQLSKATELLDNETELLDSETERRGEGTELLKSETAELEPLPESGFKLLQNIIVIHTGITI